MDVSSTDQQVAAFLRSRGIGMDCDNIEACHPLPRRNLSDQPAVIIIFANRKHKRELLKQGRKLKGTNNEHLTSHNAAKARAVRHLKKTKEDSTHLDIQLQDIHETQRYTRGSQSVDGPKHGGAGQIPVNKR